MNEPIGGFKVINTIKKYPGVAIGLGFGAWDYFDAKKQFEEQGVGHPALSAAGFAVGMGVGVHYLEKWLA